MRSFVLNAIAFTLVHGIAVPLQQIRTVHQVQSANVVFNPPAGDIDSVVVPCAKEESIDVNVSTSALGCSSERPERQRNVHKVIQHRHKLNISQPDDSNMHEEFPCMCPNAEEFLPCICDCCSEPGGVIDCSQISDVNQLKIKFQTTEFPIKKYTKFQSRNTDTSSINSIEDIPCLPENVFNDVSFKKIYMTFGVFKHVHPEAFMSSVETLEELSMTCSYYLTLFPELVEFPYLNKLELSSNAIELLPVVAPQPSLIRLLLDYNKINQVMPYAFANLPSLQVLDLAVNRLTALEENTMHLTSDTPSIYMDSNRISYIDDKAFSGTELVNQPGFLDITNNNLTTLKEPVFRKILETVSSLMLDEGGVNVNKNPLDCNSLTWLTNDEELKPYLYVPQCPSINS
ncbi:unnamed protein product [Meganyctiphanes norvegica]|uniref:Oplophorus-luciferin 2-monooxygenase non-catalytic subunit n=1 Tax=Meganyctiphanes norvegica TaxID=48144 RepID=A0AAV2Q1P1_MEGNR